MGYRAWDFRPLLADAKDPSGKPQFYNLIEPSGLQNRISATSSPGEFELLDAQNLMERGDYSGAVQRIVTAIEVIVEAAAGDAVRIAKGESAARNFLINTKMQFDERVKIYQSLTGRQLPSPLASTLEKTRGLRKKMVYGAYRVGSNERGLAQKAVDTGRWIFNWFENDASRAAVREQKISLRSLRRDLDVGILFPQRSRRTVS